MWNTDEVWNPLGDMEVGHHQVSTFSLAETVPYQVLPNRISALLLAGAVLQKVQSHWTEQEPPKTEKEVLATQVGIHLDRLQEQ